MGHVQDVELEFMVEDYYDEFDDERFEDGSRNGHFRSGDESDFDDDVDWVGIELKLNLEWEDKGLILARMGH